MERGEQRQRLGTACAVAVAAALAAVALAGPDAGPGPGEPVVARPFKNPATPPEQVAVARPVRLASATAARRRAVSRTNAAGYGCALSGRGGAAAG
jgi:hypothetical protein